MLLLLPINIFLALSPGYEDLYNYVISISSWLELAGSIPVLVAVLSFCTVMLRC